MEKNYELKSDYVGSQDNVTQQKLLEASSIIEDAPKLLMRGYNPIISGKSTCKCNCKCRPGGGKSLNPHPNESRTIGLEAKI